MKNLSKTKKLQVSNFLTNTVDGIKLTTTQSNTKILNHGGVLAINWQHKSIESNFSRNFSIMESRKYLIVELIISRACIAAFKVALKKTCAADDPWRSHFVLNEALGGNRCRQLPQQLEKGKKVNGTIRDARRSGPVNRESSPKLRPATCKAERRCD